MITPGLLLALQKLDSSEILGIALGVISQATKNDREFLLAQLNGLPRSERDLLREAGEVLMVGGES